MCATAQAVQHHHSGPALAGQIEPSDIMRKGEADDLGELCSREIRIWKGLFENGQLLETLFSKRSDSQESINCVYQSAALEMPSRVAKRSFSLLNKSW